MSDLNPKVFEKAAAHILSGRSTFCCVALECAAFDNRYERFLSSVFKPRGRRVGEPWWTMRKVFEPDCERREARILALLLCAEMCKR